MTAVKKLALLVFVLATSSTSVEAGPMGRSSFRWTTWFSNQSAPGNDGNFTISGPAGLNFLTPVSAPPPIPAAPDPAPAATPLSLSPVAPPATFNLMTSSSPAPIAAAKVDSTPVSYSAPTFTATSAPPATPAADAYIDLNGGPYLSSDLLTSGNAQPWYNSPTAIQAFGGVPNADQQASFDQAVLSHVQQTFALAGMNPTLTLDPNSNALHTISVVSGTGNPSQPDAIGMAEIGGNGFSYMDKFASLNLNSDQLAWAIAHNISHELMHTFGVAEHPDPTGHYLDAASATSSVLTDPNTTFSPAAVELIKQTNYGEGLSASVTGAAELVSFDPIPVDPTPVPEPATVLVWGVSAGFAVLMIRRNRKSASAA